MSFSESDNTVGSPQREQSYVEPSPLLAILGDMIQQRLDENEMPRPHPMRRTPDVFGTVALGGNYMDAPRTSYINPGQPLIVDDWKETDEPGKRVWTHSSAYFRLASYVGPLLRGTRNAPRMTAPPKDAFIDAEEVRQLLAQRDFTTSEGSGFQEGAALHFEKESKGQRDFAALRVYVASGLAAFGVTKQLLHDPAFDVDGGKIWYPDSRTDAPIFYTSSHEQLESVLNGLYALRGRNQLITYPSAYSLGRRIKSLPGVYIGQAPPGNSFNGVMEDMWGEALPDALRIHNLPAGAKATESWRQKVVQEAITIARRNAPSLGMSALHHAFRDSEPINDILATVRACEAAHT